MLPAIEERLAKSVDQTLSLIQKKQDEHKIETTPYVFVKNNSGTYGMGVIYVTSGEEILNMNRKLKNKMIDIFLGKLFIHCKIYC